MIIFNLILWKDIEINHFQEVENSAYGFLDNIKHTDNNQLGWDDYGNISSLPNFSSDYFPGARFISIYYKKTDSFDNTDSANIISCFFHNCNNMYSNGGGISVCCLRMNISLLHNTFFDCFSAKNAGAIYCHNNITIVHANCIDSCRAGILSQCLKLECYAQLNYQNYFSAKPNLDKSTSNVVMISVSMPFSKLTQCNFTYNKNDNSFPTLQLDTSIAEVLSYTMFFSNINENGNILTDLNGFLTIATSAFINNTAYTLIHCPAYKTNAVFFTSFYNNNVSEFCTSNSFISCVQCSFDKRLSVRNIHYTDYANLTHQPSFPVHFENICYYNKTYDNAFQRFIKTEGGKAIFTLAILNAIVIPFFIYFVYKNLPKKPTQESLFYTDIYFKRFAERDPPLLPRWM